MQFIITILTIISPYSLTHSLTTNSNFAASVLIKHRLTSSRCWSRIELSNCYSFFLPLQLFLSIVILFISVVFLPQSAGIPFRLASFFIITWFACSLLVMSICLFHPLRLMLFFLSFSISVLSFIALCIFYSVVSFLLWEIIRNAVLPLSFPSSITPSLPLAVVPHFHGQDWSH